MKALVLKDLLVLAKQMKILLFIIPFIAVTGGPTLFGMTLLLGASMPFTALAYDERSKWGELALMFPYSKNDLVLSKYVLGYIGILIAGVLSYVSTTLASLVMVNFSPIPLQTLVLLVSIALIYLSISTLIQIKYGTEKGRIMYWGIIIVFTALGSISQSMNLTLPSLSSGVTFSLAIVLNLISIQVAKK